MSTLALHRPGVVSRRPAGGLLRPRDLKVLGWLGEQYGAPVDQLEVLLGCGPRTVQRVVSRLAGQRLMQVHRLLYGKPAWVVPTGLGHRVTGDGFRAWTPNLGLLAHVAAVNDVRLHIQGRSPESAWVCERALARDRTAGQHLPDGLVVLDGREMAVEVELTVKSAQRLESIISELITRYSTVLYFCSPQAHKRVSTLAEGGRWPGLAIRDLPTIVGDRP